MTARQVPHQGPRITNVYTSTELCPLGHKCPNKDLHPYNQNCCNRFHELQTYCENGPNCEFRFNVQPEGGYLKNAFAFSQVHSHHPCRFSHSRNPQPVVTGVTHPQFNPPKVTVTNVAYIQSKPQHVNIMLEGQASIRLDFQRIIAQEIETKKLRLQELDHERNQLHEEIRRLQQQQIR